MSDLFMNMQQRRLSGTTAAAATSYNGHSTPATATATTITPPTSSHATDQSTHAENDEDDDDDEDGLANLLCLKLKKPKHWKWELTTSRSCSNIALPRILLYDHEGALLVDANSQAEQVYKQRRQSTDERPAAKTRKRSKDRAATSNMAYSIRQALDSEFNGLQIQEATPTPSPERNTPPTFRRPSSAAATTIIDFQTNELPDYRLERRSNSLKGVRFKVDDLNSSVPLVDLPTPPSTVTSATTPTATTGSSSSGPREKRRYRRSHSSGRSSTGGPHSESILERFSFNKGRFSSPEFAQEHEVYKPPRYFLRTSKAGTLVVQEESFSRHRRRRRPKHSSSGDTLNAHSPKSQSTSSLKLANGATKVNHLRVPDMPQHGSLQDVAEMSRKQTVPVRRYRSDGNVLLHKQFSTSEEDEEKSELQRTKALMEARQQRRYTNFRRHSKRDMVTIDPDNGVRHSSFGSATAR